MRKRKGDTLWCQDLSWGGRYPVLVLAGGRGYPSQVLGHGAPLSIQPGPGQGTPSPLPLLPPPPARTRTEYPLPHQSGQGEGYSFPLPAPPHPPPPQQDIPWAGYSAGGMPLEFSRRTLMFKTHYHPNSLTSPSITIGNVLNGLISSIQRNISLPPAWTSKTSWGILCWNNERKKGHYKDNCKLYKKREPSQSGRAVYSAVLREAQTVISLSPGLAWTSTNTCRHVCNYVDWKCLAVMLTFI